MKIAVFYHCVSELPEMVSDGLSDAILCEQMASLMASGLANEANEIHIGVSGRGCLRVATLAPSNAIIHEFGVRCDGERPTLCTLQRWAKEHADWAVCYHHMKGVSHPGDACGHWRRCMEWAVIWTWRRSVEMLRQGYDTTGAHWLTPDRYQMVGMAQRFWGGNFWWAKASFINELPLLPPTNITTGRYYDGEAWIGTGSRNPKVKDFAPHWPLKGCG